MNMNKELQQLSKYEGSDTVLIRRERKSDLHKMHCSLILFICIFVRAIYLRNNANLQVSNFGPGHFEAGKEAESKSRPVL